MRPLFKLLEILTEMKVPWCLQSQGNFYNISITTPEKKMQAYSTKDIDQIEQYVEVIWGHLLDDVKPVSLHLKGKATDTTIKTSAMPRPF